jgi:C-terminal peptidase prc
VLVACAAWLEPAAAQPLPRNCSIPRQNLFVRDVLQDLYLWDRFLPDLDPTAFGSPEAFLEAVRYRPLDDTFSYIAPRAATEAFYARGQFVGVGLANQTTPTGDGLAVEMRVAQVFPESPASDAGIARGDRILSIGGRAVDDWWRTGQLAEAFGRAEIGDATVLVYQRGTEEPIEATLIKRLVTIPTVSAIRVYEQDGRRIGYLFFRSFVEPAVEALDDAFVQLQEAGISELILDLRYNGGGLVSVAQHLASLIGGRRTIGLVLAEYVHNAKNGFRNQTLRFLETAHALALDRLLVITSKGSASASELVINGLRPYMPVVLIGDDTYGKPVGQYGVDFCDKTAFPVAFAIRNGEGQGDFFGGIPATCPARDALEAPLGDPAEDALAEALHFLRTGACRTPAASASGVRREGTRPIRPAGFRALLGAW